MPPPIEDALTISEEPLWPEPSLPIVGFFDEARDDASAGPARDLASHHPADVTFVGFDLPIGHAVDTVDVASLEGMLRILFDESWYLARHPDIAASGMAPFQHLLEFGVRERRSVTPLFDLDYYEAQSPDLVGRALNPLVHYLTEGADRDLDPLPLFKTSFYRGKYPDRTCVNPLVDYVASSAESTRDPHPLFESAWYLGRHPEAGRLGQTPLGHYILSGRAQDLSPHPLFDPAWYRRQHADVERTGVDPLLHFLAYGAGERRSPHPLFDSRWYLDHYPDVVSLGRNPLVHYLEEGWRSGRDPHPWFDSAFYEGQDPAIAETDQVPLVHYATVGAGEDRDPHPRFDAAFYVRAHPEAAGSALVHYLESGAAQGWPTRKLDLSPYIPATPKPRPPLKADLVIDIVVPVYRGLEETRRCLDSVLEARNAVKCRVLVIDDATPEPGLAGLLDDLAHAGAITLLRNPLNIGFVGSVNRGMTASASNDVVLLNSDTEVPDGWLDRLAAQAYADKVVGTVTPFSNNATICGYPTTGNNPLPDGETLASLDRACRDAHSGRFVDLPTAVGFCMYIRRDCLSDVGLFDQEAFGAGYGEENDFCLRASRAGWKHRLACDTFVLHKGEVSFGPNSPSRVRAQQTLLSRYPDYPGLIARHVRRDDASPMRLAVTAARYRADGKPVILMVSHSLGGGTEKHLRQVMEELRGRAHFLILLPHGSDMELSAPESADHPKLRLGSEELDDMIQILRSFAVSRVHVHHWLGAAFGLKPLLRRLDVPFDVTVHDYFAICPQVTLSNKAGTYCGEPDLAGCNACIAERPSHDSHDILWWRKSHEWLFNDADRVIVPSADVAARLRRYLRVEPTIVPHELPASFPDPLSVSPAPVSDPDSFRIVLLGVIAAHKGATLLEAVARLARLSNQRVQFHIVGNFEVPPADLDQLGITQTGPYLDTELPALLAEAKPHLLWFASQWPETYSYTLSAGLRTGLPVLATRIGSFPERLEGRPRTWFAEAGSDAADMLELFACIRHELTDPAPVAITARPPKDPAEAFYQRDYLRSREQAAGAEVKDLRQPGRIHILLIPELLGGVPSPCAYIRLLLPLTHPGRTPETDVTVVTAEEALRYRADHVVCHRIAIPSLAAADELIAHCRRFAMRLVYDLDDELLGIGDDHPEAAFYRGRQPVIRHLVAMADEVRVSTQALRERLSPVRPAIELIPNQLDDRIWRPTKPRRRRVGDPVRMLYMGTNTHAEDLRLIEPAIRRLKAEFGKALVFDIVGIAESLVTEDWRTVIPVPSLASRSYPAFVHWLQERNNWDIGVAPLVESPFALCKSGLKVCDYAALGLLIACTETPAYWRFRHMLPGRIFFSPRRGWYDVLKKLCSIVQVSSFK